MYPNSYLFRVNTGSEFSLKVHFNFSIPKYHELASKLIHYHIISTFKERLTSNLSISFILEFRRYFSTLQHKSRSIKLTADTYSICKQNLLSQYH